MSGYHVWAARLGERLSGAEFRRGSSDDLAEITATARDLTEHGFMVVIFDDDERRLGEYWPDGRVVLSGAHPDHQPGGR